MRRRPDTRRVTIELPQEQWARLALLADAAGLDPERLLRMLLEHVDGGLQVPGSWEREWLEDILGDHAVESAWLAHVAGAAQIEKTEENKGYW